MSGPYDLDAAVRAAARLAASDRARQELAGLRRSWADQGPPYSNDPDVVYVSAELQQAVRGFVAQVPPGAWCPAYVGLGIDSTLRMTDAINVRPQRGTSWFRRRETPRDRGLAPVEYVTVATYEAQFEQNSRLDVLRDGRLAWRVTRVDARVYGAYPEGMAPPPGEIFNALAHFLAGGRLRFSMGNLHEYHVVQT